jgi:hypothetical protein
MPPASRDKVTGWQGDKVKASVHLVTLSPCHLVTLLLLGALLTPGCSRKPEAPALRDEPVYENAQEGFRFLAPENWTQHARATIPPGKVDKERLLVGYRRNEAGKSALLEVSRADLSESESLTEYLAGPAFSRQWKAKGPPKELEINGVLAVRNIFLTGTGKDEQVREVVTFRRGERCYFFNGLYQASDDEAREQIRRSVGSVIWK